MNVQEAQDKMTEVLESALVKFQELGIDTKIEYDYMDRLMNSLPSIEKAKYLTVTLVLSTAGIPEGEEYCLSLGAEVKNKKVQDDILEGDIENYNKTVDETIEAIKGYDTPEEAIKQLANEASEEFQELVKKIKESDKKQKLTSIIGIVCVIAIFILLTVLSITSGSAG